MSEPQHSSNGKAGQIYFTQGEIPTIQYAHPDVDKWKRNILAILAGMDFLTDELLVKRYNTIVELYENN